MKLNKVAAKAFTKAKPSEVIFMALDDLAAVEKNKKLFKVDMGTYHDFREETKKCHVCLAGALLVNRLDFDPKNDDEFFFRDIPDAVKDRLYALDEFRCGHIREGLDLMGVAHPPYLVEEIYIPPYPTDATLPEKRKFKAAMLKMADALEGMGL